MFKWIARKILSKEICDYLYEIQKLNYQLKTCEKDITKYSEYDVLKGKTAILQEENERLKKENDILREYYKLDEEPSDEIKTKIHIDMRIHDLEMKLLQAYDRPLAYIPVPMYTSYYGGYGI